MSKPIADRCALFAGPTVTQLDPRLLNDDTIALHPPAKRGDIEQWIAERPPGVIAIVDGTFHAYPAVGHAELLHALQQGWQVWGLSSMGAIRACEMACYGMRGFGEVYQRYVDDPDFTDDEVTLIHQTAPPYTPLSEPLIHIRQCLTHLAEQQLIDPEPLAHILSQLKNMWYGHRTLNRLRALLSAACNDQPAISRVLANFEPFRIKTHDLTRFLQEKPWLSQEITHDA